MGNCEMCGKEADLFLLEVEGTRMNVCRGCGSFGTIVKKPTPQKSVEHLRARPAMEQEEKEEVIDSIVENYSQIIRSKRDSLGMTQKRFARFISERESLLQNMETGKFEPPLGMARKLEKLLDVKMTEKIVVKKPVLTKSIASAGLTLGDFIKKK